MKRRLLTAAAVTLVALGGLSACSTIGSAVSAINPFDKSDENKTTASQGERISIIAFDQRVEANETLKGADFYLPAAEPRADWPLPGGTPEQSIEHVQAAPNFQVAWRKDFGKGSDRSAHVTAPPVAAEGKIFVMDGEATVVAIDAKTGNEIWSRNLKPKERRDRDGFGGGVAYADGKLYVTSGFRFVAQLDAATGEEVWKRDVSNPIHGAPTVSGGRLFVVNIDNELLTFDTATGAPSWNYQALTEPARILSASSPAIAGDTIIAPFSSGELVALRTGNGNEVWSEALSRASRTNALSEIRDIAGRPVIYKGDVLAVSHSGVFSATDLRTGQQRWNIPVTGIGSPWGAGDVAFVVSKAGEVICVARETGQVYWIRNLNSTEGFSKRQLKKRSKNPIVWSSPILASDRLITVSSRGEAAALNPKTGEVISTLKLGAPALIAPIAVDGMIYVVSDEAKLIAIN
ncbi:outer membrane protein assembly factor BamB family protein [Caulobacter sp. NIBR2454]|uniref:outer membrane protein assembly factor BamB family protein n=1 Tax=Caulobacter sp. NIBR2454 TaxID=3015996 RepID=UPI0022B6373D|nr:PQQ-binding-like beta-propeller repeat protein [Caulobacter sp. NIBR2454]